MIQKFSNQELNASLKRHVANERKLLHAILLHINEVAARKLYLEMAYSSLYEYLVKECCYSGSAAMRRISAAELLREVPEVSEKIQSGTLNLSQIGELSRAIKEKRKGGPEVSIQQKTQLIGAIAGKTVSETQREISLGLDLEIKIPEKKFTQKDDSVRVEMTLSKEKYEKLLRCKDLGAAVLLSEYNGVELTDVIEFLADFYLKSKKMDKTDLVFGRNSKINKTVTPRLKRTILQRDVCCQFKDPHTGKICGSTFGLEIDHKQPRWAEGSNSDLNLQALCKAHNNYKYRRGLNLRLL
ncbi:MAG: HNH endonuclease signature motif containing protein [Bdellovibrio sp.]